MEDFIETLIQTSSTLNFFKNELVLKCEMVLKSLKDTLSDSKFRIFFSVFQKIFFNYLLIKTSSKILF